MTLTPEEVYDQIMNNSPIFIDYVSPIAPNCTKCGRFIAKNNIRSLKASGWEDTIEEWEPYCKPCYPGVVS